MPIVVLLLIGLYGSDVVRQLYADHLKADLEARARLAGKPIDDLLPKTRPARSTRSASSWAESTDTRITVVLPSGEVDRRLDENPRDMDNHRSGPKSSEALAGASGPSTRFSTTEQEERHLRGDSARCAAARRPPWCGLRCR